MLQYSFTEITVPVPRSVPGKRFRRFRFRVRFLRKRFRRFLFPVPVLSGPQKGPAERGHVKKRQKVSKIFSTFFGLTTDIFVAKFTRRGLVVKRPGVLSKVQMLNLVLGVGVFSPLPK